MQISSNPYKDEIEANLPRILALIDRDKTSSSYGMGDRYHWAWGLIDFGNGTFQGVAHGLTRVWKSNLWPYPTHKEVFLERIDSIYKGAKNLTNSSGSLEEAFPNEGSYCVTALVAFDLLCALELLSEDIDKNKQQEWKAIIEPMISYLIKADETHAMISNHLATATAALLMWVKLTDSSVAEKKAKLLLDRILSNQSSEGWFDEYSGADPGYQTLCTYYLAFIHLERPDLNLEEPLAKSINFLWNFAHPDGSFGGLYGSRCTRFFIPAGILALSRTNNKAAALSNFMTESIRSKKVITLSSIDEPNLIPIFNSYCWAASLLEEEVASDNIPLLPFMSNQPFTHFYNKAGLFIDRGIDYYTIINTSKGGIIYHYCNGSPNLINGGVVIKNNKNKYGSSLSGSLVNFSSDKKTIEIISKIGPMPKSRPGPLQFIVLRFCSVSLFKSFKFREWVKKALVKFLIREKKPWQIKNTRTIYLGKKLRFKDKTSKTSRFTLVKDINNFVPIHMASQGYWQIQDEIMNGDKDDT